MRSILSSLEDLQDMRVEIDRLQPTGRGWEISGLLRRKMDAWDRLRWDILDEMDDMREQPRSRL